MIPLDNEFRSHVNTIVNANRNKTLAFFVGAGISKTVETTSNKLPDWAELIAKIRNEISDNEEQDYLKIAQLYYITFGEHKYHNTIKGYFPETIGPSIIHETIFDLNPQIIITTNWDNILENAIRKQGYLYDVICSDAELVRSTLPKKIIKMHGDFAHHNFVFKEEDYINYSEQFPLIENYIKGILTTHTVVFLGYSYNDIDIKHIIKWIQSRSTCRPPMFITVFEDNQGQKQYLNNYGITTLVLKEENTKLPDTYSNYTKRIHCFLENLYSNGPGYKLLTNDDIINFVYNKIIVFDDLQNILLSQIESVLAYCRITFSKGFPVLMFLLNLPSTCLDEEIISIYGDFINIIHNIDEKIFFEVIKQNKKLGKIFEIFYRSGIRGIMFTDKMNGDDKILILDSFFSSDEADFFENIVNFNFRKNPIYSADSITEKMSRVFIFYQQEQYEKIVPFLEEIISECRIERRWILLFIAMLNKNIILRHLKYNLFRHEYDTSKEFDLYEEYEKLPEEIKTAVKPIYDFLEFNDLYKLFFSITRDLATKEGYIKTRRSGGMVFGTDGGKNFMQQENLLRFVIGNKIMIENYIEYRDIHKKILSITFTEQTLDKTIEMNRIELYVAIKYLDKNSLKELLEECSPNIDAENRKEIVVSEEDKKWLVENIFINLSEQHIGSNYVFSSIENYLLNTIFILSLIKLSKSVIDSIIHKFNTIIANHSNSISLYQGINSFLGMQYNLFASEIDPKLLVQILESIIRKIIKREMNMHERHSLINYGLRNIFGYAKKQQVVFDDEKAVKQLILEISDSDQNKKEIVSSILLNIYLIGTQSIQQIIKDFVLNIENTIDDDNSLDISKFEDDLSKPSGNQIDIGSKIIFEINLDIVGLRILSRSIIEKIRKYLSKYEDGSYYDSYADSIIGLIIAMYEERKDKNIANLYNVAKKIRDNRRRRHL